MENYEKNYTDKEIKEVEEIISLEKAALDKWFNGDTSGYRNLWSNKDFSYFDGVNIKRIDNHEDMCKYLDMIEGKLHADKYDFCEPRVQFGKDMALLTYQLFAKTNMVDMKYNCVELYKKEDGKWQVIHSTWCFIRPMDMDFESLK